MNKKQFESIRKFYIEELTAFGAKLTRNEPIYTKDIKLTGLEFELDTKAGILKIFPTEDAILSKFVNIDKAKEFLPHGWNDRLSLSGKFNFHFEGLVTKEDFAYFISTLYRNNIV